MKRAICSLVLLSAASLAFAQRFEQTFGECVDKQSKLTPFNGVIAVRKGDAHYLHAHGFTDATDKTAVAANTPFRLASVGKVFTQLAIGLLLQQKKLSLSASIRTYLPELPESFQAITIAHLLQHRSGVAAMTRPDMADAPTMAGATRARDLVELIASKSLSFAAGERQEYSNGGYLLLGAVIESVSGERYRDFIAAKLFKPLGMKASAFEPAADAAVPLTRMAGPGQPPAARPQPRFEFPEFKASSAGDALSSASDLERLAAALVGEKLLNAKTKAAIFPRSEPWRLGQAGGSVGSNTGFWVYPEKAAWIVVLSNNDPPAGELMGQILQALLTGESCQPKRADAAMMRFGS